MMQGVIDGLNPEVIIAGQLYDFERSLSGIDEMPEEDIKARARIVAEKVVQIL